jgi:hypothetical protein
MLMLTVLPDLLSAGAQPFRLPSLCSVAACRAYLCNIITIWVYQLVPLLSALGVQPVAFSPEFRVVSVHKQMYILCVHVLP